MKKWLSSPYIIWSVLFIVFPLFLVVYFSFTVGDTGTQFTLNNYKVLAQPLYVKVFMRSINLALVSTLVCLIVGYPMAMILADKEINKTGLAVLLFVAPMWIDRKSTRLNSSHANISYAVFCLKKKKKNK